MAIFIRYLAIAYLVYWIYRRLSRLLFQQAHRQQSAPQQGPRTAMSAHNILGIRPGANADEIKAAYKHKISEYHPDKVAHLGDELQTLAKLKSKEINQAYKELT
ncbi:MAG: DnaJ domain-containing protein [Bdellovibrionaceae bacterium]|jgi:DnaJ-domain-containing protein 1|nr:DnaJ domain-containing protein [Pseudobdellovibrionaceae bacterium]